MYKKNWNEPKCKPTLLSVSFVFILMCFPSASGFGFRRPYHHLILMPCACVGRWVSGAYTWYLCWKLKAVKSSSCLKYSIGVWQPSLSNLLIYFSPHFPGPKLNHISVSAPPCHLKWDLLGIITFRDRVLLLIFSVICITKKSTFHRVLSQSNQCQYSISIL